MTNNHSRFYNLPPVHKVPGEVESGGNGGRRVIPHEAIMAIHHKAYLNGKPGARCELCGIGYAMDVIRWVRISAFRVGHVCVDCKKANQLQLA